MLMQEMKDGGYKIFNRMKPEAKAMNIATLQYIESIAARCGTNISTWDIEALFLDGSKRFGRHLIHDKNQINKIFFENEVKYRENVDEALNRIRDEVTQKTQAVWERQRRERIANLRRDAHSLREGTRQYEREIFSRLSRATQYEKEANQIEGSESANSIADQIMMTLKENFWEFLKFQDDRRIIFVTKADIILQEINPAAGINLRVNLGRFAAQINLGDMELKVTGLRHFDPSYNGNVLVSGYYHPHLSTSSNPCWGNASDRAQEYQTRGRIYELLKELSALITSYSGGAPYISLVQFQNARPQDQNPDARERASHGQTPIQTQMAPPWGEAPALRPRDPSQPRDAMAELRSGLHEAITRERAQQRWTVSTTTGATSASGEYTITLNQAPADDDDNDLF